MKAFVSVVLAAGAVVAAEKVQYPQTRTVDQVDTLHGIRVDDPYRWLEDLNSADTKAWVEAQNSVTKPYLDALTERAPIRERLTQLYKFERFSAVSKAGDRYFWLRSDGVQDRAVLYMAKSLNDPGEVLIDPNKFADKTVALAGTYKRRDGKAMAYLLQKSGSDWMEIAFMDLEKKQELPDRLKWVKFSGAHWSGDGKGIYYARYDEPNEAKKLQNVNEGQKIFYHKLGTPQSEDKLVYFRPEEPQWLYSAFETDDGKYLMLEISRGKDNNSAWFYRPVTGDKWVELLPKFDAEWAFVGNEGTHFFFQTNLDASKRRVVDIDITHPEPSHWHELIAQSNDSLDGVSYFKGQFIGAYLKDARSEVRIFDRHGKKTGEVPLPGIGRADGFGGRQDQSDTFYSFSSYTTPTTIYHFDLKTHKSTVFRQPKIAADTSKYKTDLVFYESKDGTRVPMFVTSRKDIQLDGTNPVYLYGYGGFNISAYPVYNPAWMTWLEMGGVVAHPCLRGGAEYGSEWHLAGTRERKQNVFNDFIAAAEYLVKAKYTTPSKIAINGGSNGGLLVAACVLQRPDLFGASWAAVGVLDMLRFHKFTIGWAWVADYGSPDNPEEFRSLLKYSPYHNVKPGTKYPPMLITTADHDDRVVPAHSFKFVSAMQAAQAGDAPILIRIQTEAGHGAGKPQSMAIAEQSDALAFLAHQLGVTPKFARADD